MQRCLTAALLHAVLSASVSPPKTIATYEFHDESDDQPIDQRLCHSSGQSSAPLNFSEFCSSSGTHCWPALWLLGAQKAASSAVYEVLEQCDVVAAAWPAAAKIGTVSDTQSRAAAPTHPSVHSVRSAPLTRPPCARCR